MEKFIISRLISIVFVFIPTFALAKDDEPAIKIKTETFNNGIIVETYEKGTSEYKVYRRKNGDYFMDIDPYEMRWTLKDKTLIKGNKNDVRIKFPNGNILYMSNQHYNPVSKYKFVENPDMDMLTLWGELDTDNMDGFADVNNHPGKSYPIVVRYGYNYKKMKMVYIGNNVFEIDVNGNLVFVGKEVEGIDKTRNEPFKCFVFAIPTDSIIECVKYEKENPSSSYKDNITKISYANGDEVFLKDNEHLAIGTHIHRGYGLLTIKGTSEKERSCYINFDDGRIFKTNDYDAFKEEESYGSYRLLKHKNLTPYTGTLINKDNTGVVIKEGMTQEEREKQSELARKKEEANKKAGYDLLCKAYGKKYVDAAMKGNLIIGMPEDLFLLGYPNTRLRQKSQGTKVYEVRNILNKITKVVRVRNGRVSGVTNF